MGFFFISALSDYGPPVYDVVVYAIPILYDQGQGMKRNIKFLTPKYLQ